MSAEIPKAFYARALAKAYPSTSTYKIALYTQHVDHDTYSTEGECDGGGYVSGGAVLTGYKVIDRDGAADIAFDTVNDWFDVSVRVKSALVYEVETGEVLSIKKFEREVGVIGGLFTVNLDPEGVVGIGALND